MYSVFPSLFFLFVLCLIPLSVYSQIETEAEEIMVNNIQDESEVPTELSDYAETLSYYLKRPIDLNKATAEDLHQLFFLTPVQVQQILRHREKAGPFISTLELQVIPSINLEVLEQLLPFVKVNENLLDGEGDLRGLVKKANGSWMMTYSRGLQVPRGYEIADPKRSRYLGTPDKIINRIRWNARQKLKISLNMKKDAGEPFLVDQKRMGFDYYSGSILINKIGPFEKLIVGDYLLQFGQGLSLWNGAVLGRSASVANIMQQGLGIRAHTGLMESKFMRGIAVQVKRKAFEFTPFFSFNKLSASLNTDGAYPFVSSINYSGLHRTPSELNNRKRLHQMVYGLQLGYMDSRLKIGANLLHTQFDLPLKLNTRPYSQHRFEGQYLQNVSAYYQYYLYNILMFGESAHSIGTGWAHNHGLIAALGRKFSISISYRNYAKDYHAFFAQSFQVQSNLANEESLNLGFTFHPTRKIEWMNRLDYVKFPGMKYRTKLPSYSFLGRTQLSYIWYRKGHLRLRYQYKFYQENFNADQKEFKGIADVSRQQLRLIFLYKLNNSLQIGNQVEVKEFHKTNFGKQHAIMVYQDLIWNRPKWKIGGNLRLAYFSSDSYEARLFAYERDVLYGFSFPSYFRKGFRTYLNQKLRPIKGIDIWLRYALTHYFADDKLGSGLDEIAGNNKSDIKVQIRYSW